MGRKCQGACGSLSPAAGSSTALARPRKPRLLLMQAEPVVRRRQLWPCAVDPRIPQAQTTRCFGHTGRRELRRETVSVGTCGRCSPAVADAAGEAAWTSRGLLLASGKGCSSSPGARSHVNKARGRRPPGPLEVGQKVSCPSLHYSSWGPCGLRVPRCWGCALAQRGARTCQGTVSGHAPQAAHAASPSTALHRCAYTAQGRESRHRRSEQPEP